MASNSELNLKTLTRSNVTSFVQCILELVANSLIAHTTAIAIRVHVKKHEIQIIDNGIGIQKDALNRIGEYNTKTTSNQQEAYDLSESNNRMLISIRHCSNSFTIASRYRDSMETFMKVYKIGCTPDLTQIEQRPSHGTTVSIYGFHEIPLRKNSDMNTICCFITALAVGNLEVSFSVRDEEQRRVVLRIAKPHSPVDVLRTLFGKNLPLKHIWLIQCCTKHNTNYHGYVGLSDKNVMQCIFLNHRLVSCSFILNLIITNFKQSLDISFHSKFNAQDLQDKNIFVLLFLTLRQDEFTFVTENGKKLLMFRDVQKILNSIKTCVFTCIAEEITVSAGKTYLYDAQLLKQIRLKSKRSIFNDIGRMKTITPLKRGRKIVITGIKRKITTSNVATFCSNKQWNKNDIKEINQSSQLDIARAKYKKSCENCVIKKSHNDVDKVQMHCDNFTVTKDFANKIGDYHNKKDDFTNISFCSEWSDWTHCSSNKKHNSVRNVQDTFSENNIRYQRLFECMKQFDFLPQRLYGLLQYRQDKITNINDLNNGCNSTISLQGNWQHGKVEVHPCNQKEKLYELRLSHASLKYIKVINQINDEFIAAWMMYDQMKVLLMIDQHAVHERIRYEDLLLRYKAQNEGGLLSVNLRNPLTVEFSTQTCNLLLCHKMLLKKYGIILGSLKKNTLLIRAIPQCLITNNDYCNSEKMLSRIYSLINDILENRNAIARTLPLTIHNAIASEACHGAIKFGDKLTFEQCTSLMKLLRYTKSPNRCAHGRPTVIPVMELSELEKRSIRIREVHITVEVYILYR